MSKISTYDKLIQASAKYILGESSGVTIKGSTERVKAFQDVIVASRSLYEALCDQKPLAEIHRLLDIKREAAENFRRVTGNTWSL